MTTLITGASGFIGSALSSKLIARNHKICGTVRSESSVNLTKPIGAYFHFIGDITSDTDWLKALSDIDCVIHCAACAHVMNKKATNALLSAYRVVNVEGTRNLAEQAVTSGIKRFIFLSSIKVNGERTNLNIPFTPEDNPIPEDAYAISKWEAEQTLHDISARTGLEIVIIRPPLVYGPRVKGNFLSMLHWLNRNIPLPLGSIHNKRSLVSIDNLVDLIITCIDHPAAASQTFLVSDDEDLSSTELLHRMGTALGKPARLFPVPTSLLQLGTQLLGKKTITQRLLGNLQVDISKTNEILGWTPTIGVDEGLRKTAKWYLNQR